MDESARYRLLIAGERVAPEQGTYAVVNPATEQVVGDAPEASIGQAEAAAAAAAEAFPSWSRTTPEARAELLDRAADLVLKAADELVPLVQAETGATLAIARHMQVPITAARLRRYARGALEPRDIAI
ncbi:MAG: aldehyde dehydrogenase family protein, partial [Acidimicrobiales bacterium]